MSVIDTTLLHQVAEIAREAGKIVMEIYESDFEVISKADSSPVTLADQNAEKFIEPELAKLLPGVPIVGEEACAGGICPKIDAARFWLVDPVDGTKEFIKRNGEFTVNIGLIENGYPILGVIFAPALNRLYAAHGSEAFYEGPDGKRALTARAAPADGLTVAQSRSHADSNALADFLAGRKIAEAVSLGSSLKMCVIADGKADLYARLGPTMEWDTAAGQAILECAGGHLRDLEGRRLRYDKPGLRNPHFLATGKE